jgi:hypothetical protein
MGESGGAFIRPTLMKVLFAVVSLVLGLNGCSEAFRSSGAVATSEATERTELIAGELLVKFKPSTTQERISSLINDLNLKTVRYFESLDLYQFRILNDRPVVDVIQQLMSFPEVEYAEPNYQRNTMPPGR